ncbi:MAG: heavy metal translocating P-type ATPase [Bacillota bacterium]
MKHSGWLKVLWEMEKILVVLVSGSFIALGWLFHYSGRFQLFQFFMVTAALVAGYRIAQAAWRLLRYRVLGIQALVTIAAVGAIFIGEFWEAAAVTFLFALGGYLEARALERTRQALQSLVELAPRRARVRRDGEEVEVAADAVKAGEVVLVRPGEKIPVDGKVLVGQASVNQAPITGESVPVGKEPGGQVFGGTVVELGYLEVVALRVGDDTTFARILELVEEAQEAKAPTQLFIEQFARYYTPAVITLAALVFITTRQAETALTLLVIGCPGALVVAAPVSMVAAIGNAARRGILVKGGASLERTGKITAIALDKTGTITRGLPEVIKVKAFIGNEQELLQLAARAELPSEHHLGRAIVRAAGEGVAPVNNFTVVPGQGVKGLAGEQEVLVGNLKWMRAHHIRLPAELENYRVAEEEAGYTAVLVAINGQAAGIISLADQVREGAAALIRRLRAMGVKRIVMLTGDNRPAAQAVAWRVGLLPEEVRAELLPEEKVQAVRELQSTGHVVAMVGDGINDAPALAAADVGIAVGRGGTDVALETADLVLMGQSLNQVAYGIALGRHTVSNIRWNVAFAVAVVLALLAGVLWGKIFLASGMLVHEASVLLVLLNAMRLLLFREKGKDN